MKLVKKVERKSKNLIKHCSDYWTDRDFADENRVRILQVEIETDFNIKKTTLYYHTESHPLEFTTEYNRITGDYTKYSVLHVKSLDNKTARVIKESTYRGDDGKTTYYYKEWLIKLKNIDLSKHITYLRELAEAELEDCAQVFNVILNFKMFYNLLIQVATNTGQAEKYVKEVYTDYEAPNWTEAGTEAWLDEE